VSSKLEKTGTAKEFFDAATDLEIAGDIQEAITMYLMAKDVYIQEGSEKNAAGCQKIIDELQES
jgi:hypothetical protein